MLLSTLKILDFSTLLPGPFASMMLADWGAEVIRVEAPNRPDMVRQMPPFDGELSAWHGLINRSKRSLALDLKKPEAVEVIRRLVLTYDIVLEQFRPGVMDKLGIGYEALKAVNPRLIYCAITGYGQTGPYRDRAGHDINYLALAGVSSHTGRGAPVPLGVQVADIGAGSYGALVGILTAEIHRRETGEGQFVDVSMFDGAMYWNALAASTYLVGGTDPAWEDNSLNGGSSGYEYYQTRDGRYLSVGSLEPKFWKAFCTAVGRSEWIHAEIPKAEIQNVIATKTLAEWVEIFSPLDTCVEPVLKVSEALEHPQTQARGLVVDVPKPDGTAQKQIGNPLRFSASQPQYQHTGVVPGVHTREILRDIGYSDEEISRLCDNG
ncbi:MAG: CoA transferase [Anaerolineae bacterium]|nr:CoA transferase [Anaerolineae bacterium]